MERVRREIRGQGMALTMTEAARNLLATEGFDPQYGARPLRRAIQRLVEDPLSDDMLRGKFHQGDEIVLDAREGTVIFEKGGGPAPGKRGRKKLPKPVRFPQYVWARVSFGVRFSGAT